MTDETPSPAVDHALMVARFADTTSAIWAYDQLVEMELAGEVEIDGVLVAKADADGRIHIQQMTEHSTRKGLKWGIVGGAVALGFAGAAAGKARNLYHRVEVEKELADVITPGTSGILVLVSASDADAVAKRMPDTQELKTVPVDAETAGAIRDAAAAAAAAPATATPAAEG